jgi:hypothetical protein
LIFSSHFFRATRLSSCTHTHTHANMMLAKIDAFPLINR